MANEFIGKKKLNEREEVVELKPATETSPELKIVGYADAAAEVTNDDDEPLPSETIIKETADAEKVIGESTRPRVSKRFWITVGMVLALGCVVILCALAATPRAIVISGKNRQIDVPPNLAAYVNGSTTVMATATTATGSNPTPVALSTADIDVSAEAVILPQMQTSFTTAQYDAKVLALANIPAPKIGKVASGTTPSGTIRYVPTSVPSPLAALWPARNATYPNSGALLPFNRIVAYYGNFYSTQMGVLGQYPEPQMLAMLASTTAAWQAADPSTPVIPGIDYIAVTAQGSAGSDGKYRLRMPASQIQRAVDIAAKINGVVILDVQVGLSNVQTEVPLLEPFLKLPQVELALDPEFSMKDGVRPGLEIGTMDATDINFAANYLANLVRQNNLPPKILIVHRFTSAMLTNYRNIKTLPEVEIVMDMDGFGSPARKLHTYADVIQNSPIQFTGFKLFYHNDADPSIGGHLMAPSEVLRLTPNPSFIQYQ